MSTKKTKNIVHIVYPFLLRKEQNPGWELMYSIRSLYENLDFDFDITIIGDIPDFIDQSKVKYIPLKNHNINAQRQTKINQKILKATELYDNFLLFNDDIVIMNKMNFEKISVPRVLKNKLFFKEKRFSKPTSFTAQLKNTYFTLKEHNIEYDKNYVSHTPHFYETSIIKEISKTIDMAPMSFPSVLFENIYHNFTGKEPEIALNIRCGIWGASNKKYMGEDILNFDEKGVRYNHWIIDILAKKFIKKSEVEK